MCVHTRGKSCRYHTTMGIINEGSQSSALFFKDILINEKARTTKGDTKLSVYIAKYRQGRGQGKGQGVFID